MANRKVDDKLELEVLYQDIASSGLQPLWTQAKELMPFEPRPQAIPCLWKWKTLRSLAERAGELITIKRGGDRRVLALSNPGLGGRPYATSTLWGAVQYLGPREWAPAHRHSAGAIRFVLQGQGVWTTVNGDACDMRPGDLVLTPGWTWHDHTNGGDEPMIWFDGLDLPLVRMIDAIFYENYPGKTQPIKGRNISERLFRARGIVPSGTEMAEQGSPSSLLVYRWEDTDVALASLLEEGEGPMASIEFVDPTSGRSVLPTFSSEMFRILPGTRTEATRRTGSFIFVVFRGAGSSVINGDRFDWEQGDMFVAPSWAVIEHEATEQADLFAVTDAALLKALGLYREERVAGPNIARPRSSVVHAPRNTEVHALTRAEDVREMNAALDHELLQAISTINAELLDRDPGNEEWTLAELLAHLAEFPHTFADHLRAFLADNATAIGRTHGNPERLAAIASGPGRTLEDLRTGCEEAFDDLTRALGALNDADLYRTTRNVKYGEEPLSAFLNRYVLGHKREHVHQILATLTATGNLTSQAT